MPKPIKSVRQRLSEESAALTELSKDENVNAHEIRPFLRTKKQMAAYAETLKEVAESPTISERRAAFDAAEAKESEARQKRIAELEARRGELAVTKTNAELHLASIVDNDERFENAKMDLQDITEEDAEINHELIKLLVLENIRKEMPRTLNEFDIEGDAEEVEASIKLASETRRQTSYASTRDPEFLKSIDDAARAKVSDDDVSVKIRKAFGDKSFLDSLMLSDNARRTFDLSDQAEKAVAQLREKLEFLGCSKESFENVFAVARAKGRDPDSELFVGSDEEEKEVEFDQTSGIEKYLGKALKEANADLARAAFEFRDLIVKRFEEDLDVALGISDVITLPVMDNYLMYKFPTEDQGLVNGPLVTQDEIDKSMMTISAFVDGGLCDTIKVPVKSDPLPRDIEEAARSNDKVVCKLANRAVRKVIIIPSGSSWTINFVLE